MAEYCAYNIHTILEWDRSKSERNLVKHGVDFITAATVLEDEWALTIEDPDEVEQRFVTVGMDDLGRVLVVVYTLRGERVRLISARKATPRERASYSEGR